MSFEVGVGSLGGTVLFQVRLCNPLRTMVNSQNLTLEFHVPGINWLSCHACHAHLCPLLLSGPAQDVRQKKFEQERLSGFADCMKYFME